MEYLAEGGNLEFLADLSGNYDSTTHTFSSPSVSQRSSISNSDNASSSLFLQNSTSVKHVSSKKLPAAHPPRVVGGGTHHLTSSNEREEICDTFTGIMDAITGEPLNGTRYYVLTGEIYEGPFAYGGRRHGEGAIVRNVYRPPAPSISTLIKKKGRSSSFDYSDEEDMAGDEEEELWKKLKDQTLTEPRPTTNELTTESNAKFYGSYQNDQPAHGTLVTSTHTYRGPFHNHLYHGDNCTLVRSDGYQYEGEFKNGLFHGMGKEVEAKTTIVGGEENEEREGGIYTGEFEFGLRHGVGTYAVAVKNVQTVVKEEENDKDKKNQAYNDNDQTDSVETEKKEDKDETEDDNGETDNNNDDSSNIELQEQDKGTSQQDSNEAIEYYTYSGVWYRNSRQGEGTEEVPGGQRYSGQFLADKRHGYGTLYDSKTGIISEGIWRAGIHVNGNGWSVTYPNGDKYSGYAIDFIPAGYGICRYHNGDVYSGEWKNGLRHGEGICVYCNEEEYIGEWKDDKPVGNDEASNMISKKERLVDVTRALLRQEEALLSDDGDGDRSSFSEHETQRMLLSQAMAKSLTNSLQQLNEDTDEEEIIIENTSIIDDDTITTTTSSRASSSLTPSSLARRRERRLSRRKSRSNKQVHRRKSGNESSHSASDGGNEDDEKKTKREHGPPPPKLQTYPNKDTFLGHSDSTTGYREGYGIYISSATGSTYTGNFRHNLRHGYGILIHAQYGKYAGEFVDDKKEGMGTLILNDASSYHGGFKGGVFDGKGTLCERDGTVYVGEWKRGFRHGDGMETLADGRVYLGGYKDGERDGVGTMLDKSGGRVIYSGSWAHGTFHGVGVSVQRVIEPADAAAGGLSLVSNKAANNNRTRTIQYEGNFERGQRHGFGTLICEVDGTSYKGKWHRDRPVSGKWRIRYRNGSVFSGQAQAAAEEYSFPVRRPATLGLPPVNVYHSVVTPQPHGFGTMKYTNGDVYVGNFLHGKRQGKGACVFANGDKWEGDWSNDNVDTKGNGVLSMMDGAVHNFYNTASAS